jgi:hypothetical protein
MAISAERLERNAEAYHRILCEFPEIGSVVSSPWADLTPEKQDMVRQFANRVDIVQKTGAQSIPEPVAPEPPPPIEGEQASPDQALPDEPLPGKPAEPPLGGSMQTRRAPAGL